MFVVDACKKKKKRNARTLDNEILADDGLLCDILTCRDNILLVIAQYGLLPETKQIKQELRHYQ